MSNKFNENKDLICCLNCGRDTRAIGGYCAKCVSSYTNGVKYHLGSTGRNHAEEQMPLYDDYSEDSFPMACVAYE